MSSSEQEFLDSCVLGITAGQCVEIDQGPGERTLNEFNSITMRYEHPPKYLQIEPLPILLHLRLPLPLCRILPFTPSPTNTLIYPPKLHRKPRTKLLQTSPDVLNALHVLSVSVLNALLRLTLVTEDVTVSSYKDVVALVV